MKIAPTSRCKIFLSILIHFSNVVVFYTTIIQKIYGKYEEKKVGMRGRQFARLAHTKGARIDPRISHGFRTV